MSSAFLSFETHLMFVRYGCVLRNEWWRWRQICGFNSCSQKNRWQCSLSLTPTHDITVFFHRLNQTDRTLHKIADWHKSETVMDGDHFTKNDTAAKWWIRLSVLAHFWCITRLIILDNCSANLLDWLAKFLSVFSCWSVEQYWYWKPENKIGLNLPSTIPHIKVTELYTKTYSTGIG